MSRPTRQSPKQASDINRAVERECVLPKGDAALAYTKQKRVWKACERCRMKKIKCSGESPCKRCKEDGLICVTRNRKRIEPKQFPKGYAETVESTHWTMIATILKLYNMVRNNKTWDLEEPELNSRGQPVIHDIALKLGCMSPFWNLSVDLRGTDDDFSGFGMQIQEHSSVVDGEAESRKPLDPSPSTIPGADDDTAGSAEGENFPLSPDYSQTLWTQQQWKIDTGQTIMHPSAIKPMPLSHLLHLTDDTTFFDACTTGESSGTNTSIQSAAYTDYETQTPISLGGSPFQPWSSTDDFLGIPNAHDLNSPFLISHRCSSVDVPSPNGPPKTPINNPSPTRFKQSEYG